MPRVVPSQVVGLIDQLFPRHSPSAGGRGEWVNLLIERCYRLSSILDLADQVPPELIVLDINDYSIFVSSLAAIRTVLKHPKEGLHGILRVELEPLSEFGGLSPVALLRDVLAKCPAEYPTPGTTELSFINDQDLRINLRNDISFMNRALVNNEWKAATVLAGSVLEALLLWKIGNEPYQKRASAVGTLGRPIDPNSPEKWHLSDYIEVAEYLRLIGPQTATQCRLTKDFRNLIHPGRTIRLGQVCNRATALTTIASVEQVVQEILNP